MLLLFFFFSSRRRHTRSLCDWSSDVCSSDLKPNVRPPLLTGKAEEALVAVDGQRLKFTHLNKVFYPAEGYTKRDLLNYYDAVADLVLPYLKDRPLSLKRYPDGIAGEFFFQKDTHDRVAPWI